MSTVVSEAPVSKTKDVAVTSSYIAGRWVAPEGKTSQPIVNPANGETLAILPYSTAADVDRAAKDAHRAWLEWREVPVVDRVQPLYRFKALLEKNVREVATILTRENGKILEDAMTEVKRGVQMVEVACGMPSLMMGDSLNDVAKGIDCRTIRQPIGVCAGITPFNFPAMVPLWMYPFAIAAGNTFILKPSERVPMTPTRVVELLYEAGLPAGVIQLVHGGREVVEALLAHPLIKAISFVGSSPVAKIVYKEAAAHGKRVQALGGAKNHLVVMPDADLPQTVDAIMGSAFGAAGQRCLAGSVLVPVGDVAEPLLDLLVNKAKALPVGDPLEAGVQVGPLVSEDQKKRVLGYIEKGVAEGAKAICDGRSVDADSVRRLRRSDGARPRRAHSHCCSRGNLRACSVCPARQRPRRCYQSCQFVGLRQHNHDLHKERQGRARISEPRRSRHGRRQHGRCCADGIFPVCRVEEFLLRRSACARQRRRRLLHRAKGADDALVLIPGAISPLRRTRSVA